jgi:hypothetical protein
MLPLREALPAPVPQAQVSGAKRSRRVTRQSPKRSKEIFLVMMRLPRRYAARNDICNIQNKSPSASALGDWFLNLIFLTGTASPNGWLAIIIIVIIVGEANIAFHKLAYYSTNLQPI